jgi:8-oxo-dGTP diphosphatase
MPFTYQHARPALTVDAVVFGFDAEDLKVLLIERDLEPFAGGGRWALPGGFVRVGESLEDAVRRELQEETGLSRVFLEQLYTFGNPGRDPREHTVSVASYALVKLSDHAVTAATDARDARWFPADDTPPLAFDHSRILDAARDRLRAKVRYQPIGFELLPEKFTLSQLQRLYETILARTLDKRNFRKKVLALGVLRELDQFTREGAHRPARLHSFDKKAYDRLLRTGFNFEL